MGVLGLGPGAQDADPARAPDEERLGAVDQHELVAPVRPAPEGARVARRCLGRRRRRGVGIPVLDVSRRHELGKLGRGIEVGRGVEVASRRRPRRGRRGYAGWLGRRSSRGLAGRSGCGGRGGRCGRRGCRWRFGGARTIFGFLARALARVLRRLELARVSGRGLDLLTLLCRLALARRLLPSLLRLALVRCAGLADHLARYTRRAAICFAGSALISRCLVCHGSTVPDFGAEWQEIPNASRLAGQS